jgi:hypothetical protein
VCVCVCCTPQIAICEYCLTDPLQPGFQEVTDHITIFNAAMDGSKQVYRQFLRLPEGVVLELFEK